MATTNLQPLFDKKQIKIVITDSGLGGLSVCAELEKNIREKPLFDVANLIFFNSVAKLGLGYNLMKTSVEKAKIFNYALEGIEKLYKPDLILIACNTLSVIYPHTQHALKSTVPAIDVVQFGVDLIYNKMKKNENATVILFGTPTTISSNIHKNRLINKGIKAERIVNQPCYLLESAIQVNPKSARVRELIENYSSEAMMKINDNDSQIFAALCCTHYGYSKPIFRKSLFNLFDKEIPLLNPNSKMSSLFHDMVEGKSTRITRVKTQVSSRVKISDKEIESIGNLIKEKSNATYEALRNYNHDKNLFKFRPAGLFTFFLISVISTKSMLRTVASKMKAFSWSFSRIISKF
jgi:glutamate racemase